MSQPDQNIQELAPDYRSNSAETPNMSTMVAVGNIGTNRPSYSQTVAHPKYLSDQKEEFPTEEQAIVIPSIETITTEDYLTAIAQIINPRNIIAAQKISNKRMCIFLKSKNLVDEIVQKSPEITIKGQVLTIRKLIAPSKRIIISGGSPIIPHVQIEKRLLELDIKPTSAITFIRTGIKSPELAHIQSFNRQFFTEITEPTKIPEKFTVNFNKNDYSFYLNISGTCYKCRQENHLYRDCPLNTTATSQTNRTQIHDLDMEETSNLTLTQNTETTILTQNAETANFLATQNTTEIQNNKILESENTTKGFRGFDPLKLRTASAKRFLSTSPSSSSTSETETDKTRRIEKNDLKLDKKNKTKKNDEKNTKIEHALEPLQNIMVSNPDDFVFTYNTLKHYIIETVGSSNIISVTAKYTTDSLLLINTLRKLYPELTEKSMRSRFSKIINILENPLINNQINSTDDEQ